MDFDFSKQPHPKSVRIARHLLNRVKHGEMVDPGGGLKSFSSPIQKWREDADETNFLALQLEYLSARVLQDEYTPAIARTLFPVNSEVPEGAESYSFRREAEVGRAKIIRNHANDIPTIETSARKETHSVVDIGDKFYYTMVDIARAAFANEPLSAKKARAARNAAEDELDRVLAFGAPDDDIPSGLLNDSNVAIQALANAGTWASKIAAGNQRQVLEDMNALVRAIFTGSEEIYAGGVVVLPSDQFMQVQQTTMSNDNSETILSTFLRANPQVTRVASWNKLRQAGAGNADRIMAFRQDPEAVEIVIPREFAMTAPQPVGLAFEVNGYLRTAGGIFTRPLSAKYMDGV